MPKQTHTHTVHMALVGYLIVFSFVTKPGQTLEFLLWGTIVPLNFLVGYHCSIVASTPQPMAYASTHLHCTYGTCGVLHCLLFCDQTRPNLRISLVGYHCAIEFPCGVLLFYCCKYPTTYGVRVHTVHMALVGYLIVFSFVTKPGQTLEFLLWGTIVPLNFLVGYHCSIVASTPQPMAYASTLFDTDLRHCFTT